MVPLLEDSPPGPWQVAGRRTRRRFTLAPVILSAPIDGVVDAGEDTSSTSPCFRSTEQAMHNFADDEAYRDCIMAGYSSEEAIEYVLDKLKSSRLND